MQGEIPGSSLALSDNEPPDDFINEVKKDVKTTITFEESHEILNHVKNLVK